MDDEHSGPSIWLFVAAFVVLGFIGLLAVLVVGNPPGDTHPTRQTLIGGEGEVSGTGAPNDEASGDKPSADKAATDKAATDKATTDKATTDEATTDKAGAATTPSRSSILMPDGTPAPDGVTDVVVTDTGISLAFEVELDELGDKPVAVVPPMTASPVDGQDALLVKVGCARSTRESLAQLSVDETTSVVNVSAVVLVPPDAVGCNPTAAPRMVSIPLGSPLGSRTVRILSTSTRLPAVDLSDAGS